MSESPLHLLIDGNNIGRAWVDTAVAWRRNPGAGQQQLIERLRPWHDVTGGRLTVVFDGRGADLVVEMPTEEATLVVAFAARGTTADTVIEQWVGKSREPARCVVATGDRALAATVEATGARAIGPQELSTWLERVGEQGRRRLNRWRERGQRG